MIRFLQTPGPIKKIFLGGLLTIICVLMAITLIPGGFLGDALGFGAGQGVLAKVGDQEVSVQQVQQRAQAMARGRNFPPQLLPLLQQQAAQQLLIKAALISEADHMGLRVTDAEVVHQLHSGDYGAVLFPGGNFIGQQRYEDFISQNFQMSVPQFEQELKDDLLLRKLQNLVQDGVTVSDAEAFREYQAENTKVKFEYAVVTLESILSRINPTEEELKTYFEKNAARYANAIPERRKIDYVVIDQSKIADQAKVTQEDLQRYYNQHRDEFHVADEVEVRHILIKTPPPGPDGKADPKAVAAARAKAQEILNKLKAGANFAELAKKYSEDPGSKDNGGSLGWIGKGRTVPEFEKAAFELQPGQTSGLVQTTFGFHIIHVDAKRTAHQQTLDEVKAQIEPLVQQEKAARTAENLANTVASQARAAGGLQAAAAKNGLQVVQPPLIARTDTLPGIGSAAQLMDAVFSAGAKNPPEVVNVPQGYAIFQVTEIKPPEKPTFEQVRPQVESDFKQERAANLLQKRTAELSDRARAEHDLKKAAKEDGATLKTSELVGRKDQVPDIGALTGSAAVAFTLKPGAISGPIVTGRDGVVLKILDRQVPSEAEFQASKDQVREQLLQEKRNEAFEIFAFNLRQRLEKQGKIRFNKEERDRIFNARGGLAGE
jgi:peptidyl-prolyl cis-trans isomerase D